MSLWPTPGTSMMPLHSEKWSSLGLRPGFVWLRPWPTQCPCTYDTSWPRSCRKNTPGSLDSTGEKLVASRAGLSSLGKTMPGSWEDKSCDLKGHKWRFTALVGSRVLLTLIENYILLPSTSLFKIYLLINLKGRAKKRESETESFIFGLTHQWMQQPGLEQAKDLIGSHISGQRTKYSDHLLSLSQEH